MQRICARLDGIPLAVELAASRVRSLTPAEIEPRLADAFRLLRGGRNRIEHHRTLTAAVDWSYQLLTWSLTIYNVDGWVVTDRFNINSHQAVPNPDGTYTLTFNGDDDAVNPLDVPENWNGLFRCHLPSSVEGIVAYQQDLVTNHPVLPLA